MEDMCHEASYPTMLSGHSFTNKQLIFTVHPFCMLSLNSLVDVFLFCDGFFRALLILLSSRGLARKRASISAAHVQLHTCGWYSLQTVGGRGSGLSPAWLTPGRSERYCTRRWWSKSVLHQCAMCAGAAALKALTFPGKCTHRCSFIYC